MSVSRVLGVPRVWGVCRVWGGFGVFGGFSGDGRERGRRRSSEGFEIGLGCCRVFGGGDGRFVIIGDVGDGLVSAFAADFVFDLFLGAFPDDEFLSVGVVPTRETDFGGGAGRRRGGFWREYGEERRGRSFQRHVLLRRGGKKRGLSLSCLRREMDAFRRVITHADHQFPKYTHTF